MRRVAAATAATRNGGAVLLYKLRREMAVGRRSQRRLPNTMIVQARCLSAARGTTIALAIQTDEPTTRSLGERNKHVREAVADVHTIHDVVTKLQHCLIQQTERRGHVIFRRADDEGLDQEERGRDDAEVGADWAVLEVRAWGVDNDTED